MSKSSYWTQLSLFVLTNGLLSCYATSVMAGAKTAQVPVMVFEQSNDIYGNTRTFIGKIGLKIQILNSNVVVIAKAPTWRVLFYNTLSKKCISLSKEEWMHHLQYTTYSGRDWDRTTLAINQPVETMRLGRKAKIYRVAGNKVPAGISYNPKVSNADYVDMEELEVAPEAVSIMQKCLSIPYSAGVPVELVNHLPIAKTLAFRVASSGDQNYLRTLKIDKKLVPDSTFDYPVNFIAEKKEFSVINDSQRQSQIDGAFDAFIR